MRRGGGVIFFVIYLVFALYFLNTPFNFFKIPESFAIVNNWIVFIGGILILFGAFNYYRARRYRPLGF